MPHRHAGCELAHQACLLSAVAPLSTPAAAFSGVTSEPGLDETPACLPLDLRVWSEHYQIDGPIPWGTARLIELAALESLRLDACYTGITSLSREFVPPLTQV